MATFLVGSALAGLAGGLVISLFPITPYIGASYIFKSFAIAMIGGLGSVPGALVAAAGIGLAESVFARYVASQWTDAYVLVLMIAILLFRPHGIFRGTEGAALA
jgi:branched-chain amino acid transport system permease protein